MNLLSKSSLAIMPTTQDRKTREDYFRKKILPPLKISNDELDRSIRTDFPLKNIKPGMCCPPLRPVYRFINQPNQIWSQIAWEDIKPEDIIWMSGTPGTCGVSSLFTVNHYADSDISIHTMDKTGPVVFIRAYKISDRWNIQKFGAPYWCTTTHEQVLDKLREREANAAKLVRLN